MRDEIALGSGLNVFLPILLLVIIMLLVVHFVIRYRLRPLLSLAARLDQQAGTQSEPLPEIDVPQEILPFDSSINAMLTRLQEAMHKQSRFIADAAHELRTPVTALSLLAENIEKSKTGEDRKIRQQLLQQGFERLRVLVSQLLDLARLQDHHGAPTDSVSFKQVIQDAIADLHPLAEAGQVDLGVTRQEEVNVLDQDGRLGQLVRNAIDNAIRYTPAGGKVDVSLTVRAGKAIFCVEDTGPGIAEDQITQVMEPFYRVQANLQPGNGLGLAISREIAQRLGGDITLSNRPQGGVRFMYVQTIL